MQAALLQPWITVNANSALVGTFVQDADSWADFALFSGVTFWVDVADVQVPTGNTVQLTFQTSPTLDNADFQPLAPSLTLAPSTTPYVVPATFLQNTVPLARWVRWVLTGPIATWGATFRVRAVPSKEIPFTPIQLANCVLWLRADLGVTLQSGNVKTWADQSGTFDPNKNATQANTSLQPAFSSASALYGGQPVITFTGLQSLPTGTWNSALSQPVTSFVVGHTTNTSGNSYFHDSLSTGAMFGIFDAGGSNVELVTFNILSSGVGTRNTPSIIHGVFNSASSAVAVGQRTPQATGDAGTGGAAGLTIGNASAGFGGGFSLGGPLAEVIVYSRVLSAGEIGLVSSYLAGRYALAEGP